MVVEGVELKVEAPCLQIIFILIFRVSVVEVVVADW